MPVCREREEAFTGLEMAIILIAFVTVAAIFSYTILESGFFATGKSREAVLTGLGQVGTSLISGGTVIGQGDTTGTELKYLEVYIETAGGGIGIDMDQVTYTLTAGDRIVTFPPGDDRVTLRWREEEGGDSILGEYELVCARIRVTDADLAPGDAFRLQVQPCTGQGFALDRTTPGHISANAYYEFL
ncbi:MAG: flagellin [Methanomicrobiaceae archaeon]|nr:flagellin [Methanomicrobiaceae archaeon]